MLSENIQTQRRNPVTQRTEIEIAAETGNLRLTPVPFQLIVQGQAKLLLGRLVEYEHPILALFISLSEITPLHNRDSHEPQEIPRHRITLETDLLPLEGPAPAHPARTHDVSVRPGHGLDLRILHQLSLHGGCSRCRRVAHIRDKKLFPVKSHVVLDHVGPLQSDKCGADNK